MKRSLPALTRTLTSTNCRIPSRDPVHRCFSTADYARDSTEKSSYAQPAENLNHDITPEEKADYARRIAEEGQKRQIQTPWHRVGSDESPVARQKSAGAMTKGKLLTTLSRMLKLILPLTTRDRNDDDKNARPLALLVHPQQPLSYLERLIQSELPLRKDGDRERVPAVNFLAEDSMHDSLGHSKRATEDDEEDDDEGARDDEAGKDLGDGADVEYIQGKKIQTGKLDSRGRVEDVDQKSVEAAMRGGQGEGGVESYSGLGHEGPKEEDADRRFVRWSSSTEIGDFIRDAARGQEFAVQIEGAPSDIRVGVPSFGDRTYYLRMRLRKKSEQISTMADLKKECDELAHKSARRVAMGGFGILCVYWYAVYSLTFEAKDVGWDVMEPVTYLVGLSTLIGGYVWFLYHNREVSYKTAMNITISKRQGKLYETKGFNLAKWEALIEEGNALRREIKAVAQEYDVDWDESKDVVDDKVKVALRKERQKNGDAKKKTKDEGNADDP